jgi:RNA polymerase sigma-70 factor (ECF subfamily)
MDSFDRELSDNYDFVRHVASRYLTDPNDIDDLTQDVMVSAVRHSDKYQEGTNMRGWLSTMCKNTFINQYRKKAKSKEVYTEDMKEIVDNAEDIIDFDASETNEQEHLGENIFKALSTIPLQEQNLFLLVYIYGYTYDEVAEMKGMPVGTVKSALFKARQRLRDKLKSSADNMGIRYHLGD